jgi:mono/diheme cytochrome c family protein
MKHAITSLLVLGLGVPAVLAHSAEPGSSSARQVHESSVGGVIAASGLAGKAGQGYLVYFKWCAGCHTAPYEPPATQPDAPPLSPVSRLPLGTNLLEQRYKGALPAALEQRSDLTASVITTFVRRGVNAMPAFRKTEIPDADLETLIAFLTRDSR